MTMTLSDLYKQIKLIGNQFNTWSIPMNKEVHLELQDDNTVKVNVEENKTITLQETSELWHNSNESQPDGIRNVIVVSIGIRRDGTQYYYSESGVFIEVYGDRLWAYVEELIPKSLIKQDQL